MRIILENSNERATCKVVEHTLIGDSDKHCEICFIRQTAKLIEIYNNRTSTIPIDINLCQSCANLIARGLMD